MKKLYQTGVLIAATAYILADSEEEANIIANALTDDYTGIEFSSRRQEVADGLFVTGERFGTDLPGLSLSPAMTIQPTPTKQVVDLVEEFDETEAG